MNIRLYKLIVVSLFLYIPQLLLADVIERILPNEVSGVKNESLLLNGEWDFLFSNDDRWEKVQVPGELAMQGFAIEHDRPVVYKKNVHVPSDFKNKSIILRFDGVYSYTRLWVNDVLVSEHHGGFTRWETEVSSVIKTGKENEITLEVTDRLDEISYASGYAHHPIGGILRDVTLYALPKANIQNFYVETALDENYADATLKIGYVLTKDATVSYRLVGEHGKSVVLSSTKDAREGNNEQTFDIMRPQLWDAEHPNLYELFVTVKSKGEHYTFKREIGFREIEIKGNRMLVNGQPIKLRGACRHDVHPVLGRVATAETDSLDAVIFKRANMNFVRTSHYPPTECFLNYCNRLGIYVECETAVCFVNTTHRNKNYPPGDTQDNTAFTERYLKQLKEMVIGFRSHASIILWSVGNESVYGENFQLSYDWVKQTDGTRPVVFNYPGTAPKGTNVYDLISVHYPGCDGTKSQWGIPTVGFQAKNMPALFDEWTHIPCYFYTTLQNDPNIREFWGITIDKMWNNLFDAPGGLGGGIWGYIDDVFMLPEPKKGSSFWKDFARTTKPDTIQGNCVGHGEWGIVDIWRREKPEFWSTKKAYSPVRVVCTQMDEFIKGNELKLAVLNRFDHTNLNELTVRVTYNDRVDNLRLPDIKPHGKGEFIIPAADWSVGDQFLVEFFDEGGLCIDTERITLGEKKVEVLTAQRVDTSVQIQETDHYIIVVGDGFKIPFNKATGLIEQATLKGKVVIEKGPYLNLDINLAHKTGAEVRKKVSNYIVNEQDWIKDSFNLKKEGNNVRVLLAGHYASIDLKINILIESNGVVNFDYHSTNEPTGWLRESGLKFHLADVFSTVDWKRKGYWSFYPEGSFSGNKGQAPLYNKKEFAYGEEPQQKWSLDTHNYYYFADNGAFSRKPLTNQAKGMKENIYSYRLSSSEEDCQINVFSALANLGCRINKVVDEQLILYVNTRWDYPEIAWGNYSKALGVSPNGGVMSFQL